MITRLISGGVELDLTEGVATPLNYSISDVREPNTRKRNFSKEIVLPATINNIEFFKGTFNLTLSTTGAFFDPTIQVEAQLEKDGLVVMSGLIQLKSVTLNNGSVTFKVLIYSDAVDVFLTLSNIKVSELDWSDYTHVLNKTNVAATWSTSNGSGYYYPMIERGNRLAPFTWRTTDFVPYVYLREAFIKCFEFAGVAISGAFVNSTRFSQVLFGYGGGDLVTVSQTDADGRRVEVSDIDLVNPDIQPTNGIQVVPIGQQITHLIPFNLNTIVASTDFNPLLQWSGFEFTAAYSGNYNVIFDLNFDILLTLGGWELIEPTIEFVIYRNGQEVISQEGVLTYGSGIITTAAAAFNTNNTLSLVSGDQITFAARFRYNASQVLSVPIALNDTTTTGGLEILFTSVTISDGDNVVLNRFIPDMTCADLVMNTFRQFNLYMTDVDDSTVEILPFPQFYSPTNQFDDWSELVDLGKDIIVKPAANEYGKRVLFTFAQITETDAITYNDKWAKRYGDYIHGQGSYYAKGDKEIKLGWGTIIPFNLNDSITQMIVPRFINTETTPSKICKAVPRIMNRLPLANFTWSFANDDGTSVTNPTTYPLVHHFNSLGSPTFDLNFMLVDELLYTATNATTINAFSEYYFDMINEIVSPTGKIVEKHVYLTPEDIKNLSFKRLKMIDGALFRLNRVVDFDSDIAATTKVELIKVLRARNSGRGLLNLPLVSLPAEIIVDFAPDPTAGSVISSPPNSIYTPIIIAT